MTQATGATIETRESVGRKTAGELVARARPPMSPWAAVASFVANRDLIWQMIKRDVAGRYKGSVLGLAWSFFHPLLMLAVYTFAFSYVFNVRLSTMGMTTQNERLVEFAIWAFSGLLLFGLFNEVIVRSPSLILHNTSYVKRVIFPLEVMPFIAIGSSLIHAAASTIVLLGAYAVFHQTLHWTCVFFPLVLLPLMLLTLGLSWFLASLGVYLRDVAQTIGVMSMMLMYLSPVFYRIEAIPNETLRMLIKLNPLTVPIINTRRVLLEGVMPRWDHLAVYTLGSLVVAWLGFAWFQRTKRGFADVL